MSLDTLLQFDDSRMRLAAAKLTHVGPQTGPLATVVIQTCFYLPSVAKFLSFRRSGLSYANDDLPEISNFSVSPSEFRRMLSAAKHVWESNDQQANKPSLSFAAMVEAPEGIQGTELLFTYEGGVALHRALAGAIDQDNKIGQMVLQRQRESAYAGT